MTMANDGHVERLRRYATLLPQQTHMFIEECADLLEFYEKQNDELLKTQDLLLGVVDAARRYVGGGEYHERLEARNDLEDALRALDGEP